MIILKFQLTLLFQLRMQYLNSNMIILKYTDLKDIEVIENKFKFQYDNT